MNGALKWEGPLGENVTVEVVGNVDYFSSDNLRFVAGEDELSHDGGEAAKHETTTIDDNGLAFWK